MKAHIHNRSKHPQQDRAGHVPEPFKPQQQHRTIESKELAYWRGHVSSKAMKIHTDSLWAASNAAQCRAELALSLNPNASSFSSANVHLFTWAQGH